MAQYAAKHTTGAVTLAAMLAVATLALTIIARKYMSIAARRTAALKSDKLSHGHCDDALDLNES